LEFPNTLPPQDLKGGLSLAASDFAPGFDFCNAP